MFLFTVPIKVVFKAANSDTSRYEVKKLSADTQWALFLYGSINFIRHVKLPGTISPELSPTRESDSDSKVIGKKMKTLT